MAMGTNASGGTGTAAVKAYSFLQNVLQALPSTLLAQRLQAPIFIVIVRDTLQDKADSDR